MLAPSLKAKLASLEGIPTLPVFVEKLVDAIEQDSFTAKELAEIIRRDPAMSSRLLRVANSSFFGFSGQVGTLDRAVVLLGTYFVRALAVSVPILDILTKGRSSGKVHWEDFWLHSFACGWVSHRLIQRGLFPEVGEEASLCGLLHDLGKPVLWIYEAQFYPQVLTKIREESLTTHDAERAVFGTHHGEVGGELAKHWGFPSGLCGAILKHHEPKCSSPAACLVSVADSVVHSTRLSNRSGAASSADIITQARKHGLEPKILLMIGKELEEWDEEIQRSAQSLYSDNPSLIPDSQTKSIISHCKGQIDNDPTSFHGFPG